MFDDMFVSGLCGLASPPFHPVITFFSTCMLQSASLVPLFGATCFQNLR